MPVVGSRASSSKALLASLLNEEMETKLRKTRFADGPGARVALLLPHT